MPTMTIKEWVAEYKAMNEMEAEEERRLLPAESAQNSLRSYFELCRLIKRFVPEADEVFAPERYQHYLKISKAFGKGAKQRRHDSST